MQSVINVFKEVFHASPLVVRAPGRINLLGEHTDYNQGFVLPAAIDKYAYVAVSLRDDNRICLVATDLNESFETTVADIKPVAHTWCNYILGVARQFELHGFTLRGFNLVVHSEVPVGAGLSSSAALACATAFALNEMLHAGLERLQLARFAQAAEHAFAGVQCGIMDQFASLFGKAAHVIQLDCRLMAYQYIPLRLPGYEWLLFDSGVKHSLASTAYNQRRKECEEGVRLISRYYPHVTSLRDATPQQVDECLAGHEILYKRCRYVVEENLRVLQASHDLQAGDAAAFGEKMLQTHKGLQQQYEVSCDEIDFLVACAAGIEGVAGTRLMGGGFGGCTLNLVRADASARVVHEVCTAYKRFFSREPRWYKVTAADGATIAAQP